MSNLYEYFESIDTAFGALKELVESEITTSSSENWENNIQPASFKWVNLSDRIYHSAVNKSVIKFSLHSVIINNINDDEYYL